MTTINNPTRYKRKTGKLNFDPFACYLLERALASITEPARRHKCSEQAGGCGVVFECDICLIADDHRWHMTTDHPYLCEECITRLGLGSVMVRAAWDENRGEVYSEVTYSTGEVMGVYKQVATMFDADVIDHGRMRQGLRKEEVD